MDDQDKKFMQRAIELASIGVETNSGRHLPERLAARLGFLKHQMRDQRRAATDLK